MFHSGSPPLPLIWRGRRLYFWTQQNPGVTEIFQNQGRQCTKSHEIVLCAIPFFKFCPTPSRTLFVALFVWLNGWSRHIWCVIFLMTLWIYTFTSHSFVKGGNWIFELNEIRGELKIFKIKGGRKRGGKVEFLKFLLGGKLLEMKLQTENKISDWI